MTTITIALEDELWKALKKRAKKAFSSPEKLAGEIIRKSMISYRDARSGIPKDKVDDALVGIFSRERRGRKRGRAI